MDIKRAKGKLIEIAGAALSSVPFQMVGGNDASAGMVAAVAGGKLLSTVLIYGIRKPVHSLRTGQSRADIDAFLLLFGDDILSGLISAFLARLFLGSQNFWGGWLIGSASSQAGKVTRQLAGYPVIEIQEHE